ncbi:hypothetical protein FVF58_45305 [Paraburkholderia panacisoli]|uniref:Uncharacterized protein n=1 Tax=Paraburkholderia panacisoli TaxID=2603818 RepID=A0A5B0G482_9BURK|nr:hypothetical protein FVF58_45305 [Paraburkholderia panacisoli]
MRRRPGQARHAFVWLLSPLSLVRALAARRDDLLHRELLALHRQLDQHRDAFGVEPICKVLQIAPSGYRQIWPGEHPAFERCTHNYWFHSLESTSFSCASCAAAPRALASGLTTPALRPFPSRLSVHCCTRG